jgi:hypothetical protein
MGKVIYLIQLVLMLFVQTISAQTGSIKGVVMDVSNDETLVGAAVVIQGTHTGMTTDFDGAFEISGLSPGTYTLQVSFISYKAQLVENIQVVAGETSEVTINMESDNHVLEGVVIQARVLRNRENILLLDRQESVEMVQHIGAQELSRKGVGDVATAVTKLTGISKQEGSNRVFIRGLGDRYNATTLNGLPIPSNNPEEKNISLELFSTDIVEYVTVDKVYSNHIYGDFAGGNVDIVSKDFTGASFFKVDAGSKINTDAIQASSFNVKGGPDYFGFHSASVPTTMRTMSFPHSYETKTMSPIGSSYTLSGGHLYKFSNNRELNFFATAGFNNDFSVKEGISRSVNSSGYASKDLRRKAFSYETNATGMLNLGLKLNQNHRINYNLVFVNSTDNENDLYEGTILDIADFDNGYLTRLTYQRNTLIINQLLGSHQLNGMTELNWGLSYNVTDTEVPDRLQNTSRRLDNGTYVLAQNQITDNHRYFHYLNENETALNFALSRIMGSSEEDYRLKLTLGYSGRFKNRDFNATQFNFRVHTDQRNTTVNPEDIGGFFNQQNLDQGNYFRIETFRGSAEVPNSLDPQVYGGKQIVNGLYLTTEYRVNSKLTALLGLRGEFIQQTVTWNTQLDPRDKKDVLDAFLFLPSINGRYVINASQNLRFGASLTHTLPQFKERALFIYEDVTQVKIGNPDLYQSKNLNVDLSWDWYPTSGEIVSLGVFGKHIQDPINEVTVSAANSDISFLNTGDVGYVGGIEAEIRKDVFTTPQSKFQAGFNAAYMFTEQDLSSEKVQKETRYGVQFTDDKASFTGASDWLINADISYQYRWNNDKNVFMTFLGYNYFSEKLYALGTNGRGNMINKPFGTLDFVTKVELGDFSFGFNVKNMLDPKVETYQDNMDEDILIESYKRGVNMGLSLGYRF